MTIGGGRAARLLAVAAILALDAVAAQPSSADEPTAEAEAGGAAAAGEPEPLPPEIEKLLTQTSDPEAYADQERCVSTRLIRSTRILDDRHIVFEMFGGRTYLVQFQNRCFQLRPNSTLIYETRNSRLCRLDQIRATSGFNSSADIGPPCMIPGFQEVTPEQVALIDETLKARRKAR